MHVWPLLTTVPVRRISGSRIDIVKERHFGTWSGSPLCFATQKIAEKDVRSQRRMQPNIQAFTLRPEEKTNTEHTHSQGTGCKSKTCYMQTC